MSKQRNELREEMKLVTSNLDERWLKAASAELCQNLAELFESRLDVPIEHILAFQPLQHGAVDLSAFVLNQSVKGINVHIPCGAKDNFTFFEIRSEVLSEQAFNNLAAVNCQTIVDAEFVYENAAKTAVLLPGLAYDLHGNRIGWGKLHYEHLFKKSSMRQALKIGVCWELQVQKHVPAGNTDLLVDWVVHERAALPTSVEFQGAQELDFGS